MNKTISITLNGMIFHIEEDGYEELKNYLDSIKQYFAQTEGKEEIITDIESNVAEKFSSKISGKKKVIIKKDVEEIIGIMGSVQDIAQEADESPDGEEDKKENVKRLYRDPDDAVIAGVCSGLGAYFNIDPVIFRVLFVVSFLFYGTSAVLYIVLWIAMPKAENNAQKLEMRGDSVTLKTIEENIKSKVADPKTRKKLKSAPLNILNAVFEAAGNLIKKLWPIVISLAGIVIVAINLMVAATATFMAAVFLLDIDSAYINSEIPLGEILSTGQYYTGLISSYLIIIVPTVFFILIGVALAKRKNTLTTLSISVMVGIWMISLLVFGLVAVEAAPEIGRRVDQSMNERSITINKEIKDFNKILISDNNKVNLVQGEDFQINMSGREKDLNDIRLNVTDGQLLIKEEPENGICLFCYDRKAEINITMPALEYIRVEDSADADIQGFDNDRIKVEARGASDIKADLFNPTQDIEITGSADMELSGSSSALTVSMDGFSDLNGTTLNSRDIKIDLDDHSEAHLEGSADKLTANLERSSDLFAFDLKTENAVINVLGRGTAQVNANTTLESVIEDGEIYYKGNPEIITPNEVPNSLDIDEDDSKKPIEY